MVMNKEQVRVVNSALWKERKKSRDPRFKGTPRSGEYPLLHAGVRTRRWKLYVKAVDSEDSITQDDPALWSFKW